MSGAEFFVAGRGAGKTHYVLECMSRQAHGDGYPTMVLASHDRAQRAYEMAKREFPNANWEPDQFVTPNSLPRPGKKRVYYVDNVEDVLRVMFRGATIGTITGSGPLHPRSIPKDNVPEILKDRYRADI